MATNDDEAMHLTEYPSPHTPEGLAAVRCEIRRRRSALQQFRESGYERERTMTTVNHLDGSCRRMDFFHRIGPDLFRDVTPEMITRPDPDV